MEPWVRRVNTAKAAASAASAPMTWRDESIGTRPASSAPGVSARAVVVGAVDVDAIEKSGALWDFGKRTR